MDHTPTFTIDDQPLQIGSLDDCAAVLCETLPDDLRHSVQRHRLLLELRRGVAFVRARAFLGLHTLPRAEFGRRWEDWLSVHGIPARRARDAVALVVRAAGVDTEQDMNTHGADAPRVFVLRSDFRSVSEAQVALGVRPPVEIKQLPSNAACADGLHLDAEADDRTDDDFLIGEQLYLDFDEAYDELDDALTEIVARYRDETLPPPVAVYLERWVRENAPKLERLRRGVVPVIPRSEPGDVL
jgi:hypothetical protein